MPAGTVRLAWIREPWQTSQSSMMTLTWCVAACASYQAAPHARLGPVVSGRPRCVLAAGSWPSQHRLPRGRGRARPARPGPGGRGGGCVPGGGRARQPTSARSYATPAGRIPAASSRTLRHQGQACSAGPEEEGRGKVGSAPHRVPFAEASYHTLQACRAHGGQPYAA